MEIETMEKVVVPARVENLRDVLQVDERRLEPGQVRAVEIPDALIDRGATMLSCPKAVIQQLGLRPLRTRRARTAGGLVTLPVYEPVRLTVQGRDCVVEVSEVPDDCPMLIGQIPLESLDFVVDPSGRKLIGNPEHGGEQMIELFCLVPAF